MKKINLIIALVFLVFSCEQGTKDLPKERPINDEKNKTYSFEGIDFTMIHIDEVRGVVLGDDVEPFNKEHAVNLSSYFIAETEVTQELYEKVIGNNPSNFQGDDENKKVQEGENQAKRPCEKVNWYDAVFFCNELTKRVNAGSEAECVYTIKNIERNHPLNPLSISKADVVADLTKKGFRLPTEAEWEWAARAGTQNKYSGCDKDEELNDYAYYYDNSNVRSHEVKRKKPNAYGIYDMSGNVGEWCHDAYSETIFLDGENPKNEVGKEKVIRGGSFNADPIGCTKTVQGHAEPIFIWFSTGFRIACNSLSESSKPSQDKKHTVIFEVAGGNGSLKATSDGKEIHSGEELPHGACIEFQAIPFDHYKVDEWEGVKVKTKDSSSATVILIKDLNLKVKFAAKQEVVEDENGLITIPLPKENIVGEGDKGVFVNGRKIKLSPYKIAKTEVTYKLWKEVLDFAKTKGYSIVNEGEKGSGDDLNEAEPVTCVSFRDAIVWCNAYTEKIFNSSEECVYRKKDTAEVIKNSGLAEVCDEAVFDKSKKGFRLPTEAEWEWAARAGDAKTTYSGTNVENELETYAWYEKNSDYKTHIVGTKEANSFGLYDMSGNVWEWCFDFWSGVVTAENEVVTDPVGNVKDDCRIFRGGSIVDINDDCTCKTRSADTHDRVSNNVGFRIAKYL